MEKEIVEFPTDAFYFAFPTLAVWAGGICWFFWKLNRKKWHWFFIIPFGFSSICLWVFTFVVAIGQQLDYLGVDLGKWFEKFSKTVSYFLNQPLFPPPQAWHLLLLLTVMIAGACWIFRKKLFRNKSAENKIHEPDAPPQSRVMRITTW